MNIDEYRVGDQLICVHDTTAYPYEDQPVLERDVFGYKRSFKIGETIIVNGWLQDDKHFGTKKKPKLFLLVATMSSKKIYLSYYWDSYIVSEPKHWRLAMRYRDRAIDNKKAYLMPYK